MEKLKLKVEKIFSTFAIRIILVSHPLQRLISVIVVDAYWNKIRHFINWRKNYNIKIKAIKEIRSLFYLKAIFLGLATFSFSYSKDNFRESRMTESHEASDMFLIYDLIILWLYVWICLSVYAASIYHFLGKSNPLKI